jgi:catechol 2,3-dioxygenase-like lactoylglutathione lyase family enzyme
MIRVKMIDHLVLRTDQPEAMIRFYSEVLGCKVERSLPAETGLVQLRAGQSLIDLVAVNSKLGRSGGPAPSPEGNNMDHFCLQIESLSEEEICDWLGSRGVEAGTFEVRYGAEGFGRSLYIKDPDDNIVELRCVLAEPHKVS